MRTTVASCVCVVAVAGAWVAFAAPADGPASINMAALASPAGRNAGQPRLAAVGDRAVLSWIEQSGPRSTLRFAERTDAGWTAPRTVPTGAGLIANAADVPLVQPLAGGTLVAQWVEAFDEAEGTRVRLAWSKNGGRTWSAATTPHHDRAEQEHGFGALFETAGGGFGLIWLDGRAMKSEDEGDMSLRGTVFSPAGKQGPESSIDTRVCECCQTAAATTSAGPIVVYRDRSAAEVRDISAVRLIDGRWTTPTPVHRDNWTINGCPVNGPAIAADGANVAVAWFTMEEKEGRVFAAFSTDAGATFGKPVRVDEGTGVGRVQIALLADGSAAVSWIESSKSGSDVRVRRVTRAGAAGPSSRVGDASPTQYPRMVRRKGELLFAWPDQGQVKTARASIS